MSNPTPGPWLCRPSDSSGTQIIAADTGVSVGWCGTACRVSADGAYSIDAKEAAANAQLMACAPDLLAACLAMMTWDDAEKNAKPFDDDNGAGFYARIAMCQEAFDKARAAIARAKLLESKL